jgi:hypothetical protein
VSAQTTSRPGRAEAAQWRDPEDKTAMERGPDGKRHQKTISGMRVIDPLTRLPCQPEHFKAANRLRQDWERGSGATSGGSEAGKVDNSTKDHDSIAGQMEARRRYQDAVQAVGMRMCAYMLPVVLSGWTVADLIGKHGGNAMTMQGRVMSGLDRLVDFYNPPKDPIVPYVPPSPLVVDPSVTDLSQDRLGRVKR